MRNFLFSLVLLLVTALGSAQDLSTVIGDPPFTTKEPIENGYIDTASGNLHIEIPLGTFPQRAGDSIKQTLAYDSHVWSIADPGDSAYPAGSKFTQPTWVTSPVYVGSNFSFGIPPTGGWQFLDGLSPRFFRETQTGTGAGGCDIVSYFVDKDGTPRYFYANEYSPTLHLCDPSAKPPYTYATDGSGYFLSDDPACNLAGGCHACVFQGNAHTFLYNLTQAFSPSGKLAYSAKCPNPTSPPITFTVQDTNGNYSTSTFSPNLSQQSYTPVNDTLGRSLVAPPSGTSTYQIPLSGGNTSSFVATFASISVKSQFQQAGVADNTDGIIVLQALVLPDGRSYAFTYDCAAGPACDSGGQAAYYGTMTSMTLPTGAKITFGYTTFTDAANKVSRWVTSRTINGNTWNYTPTVLSTCSAGCQQQVDISGPSGSKSVIFTVDNGAWPVEIDYPGTASTHKVILNTWDFTHPCPLPRCSGHSFVHLLKTQTTESTGVSKQTTYSYDSYQTGNVTALKEWKNIPAAGSFATTPDRATYITYAQINNPSTIGGQSTNRPLSVTVCTNSGSSSNCPGGGSVAKQTLITYDSYGSGGLTAPTATNHDNTDYGVTFLSRGNPTQIKEWVSGSTYLTTTLTYDTTGQVTSKTDANQNIVHYSYADNFFNDNGANPPKAVAPNATNAYLTKVTDAVGSLSLGYYYKTGTPASVTDYNGVSNYAHFQDLLDRPTESDYPIGWKKWVYTSPTQTDFYDAVADTTPSLGCTSCVHTATVVDSLGRVLSDQLINNPFGLVKTDFSYDTGGRLLSASHPYLPTDASNNLEQFVYDGQDRQVRVAHADGQYARRLFVDDFDFSFYGGNFVQQSTIGGIGIPYVEVDESGRAKESWLDGFGNVIETDEPSGLLPSPSASITISGTEQVDCNSDPCIYDSGSIGPTLYNNSYSYNATVPMGKGLHFQILLPRWRLN